MTTNNQPNSNHSVLSSTATITWRGQDYPVPSDEEIGEWVAGDTCETPDGETVEPDHPDSWLRLLGII
jgi:hypothetical protein